MKKLFLSLFLVFTVLSAFGQENDPRYLWRDYLFYDQYIVDILEIHPDSTYTRKTWSFEDKKEWQAYKKMTPDLENGRLTREGGYYIMTKVKDGKEVTLESKIKINNRKIIFYYPNESGRLVAELIYQRIE